VTAKRKWIGGSDSEPDLADTSQEGSSHEKWVSKLQAKHLCEEHSGKHCVIGPGGIHLALNFQDISLWAIFIVYYIFFLSLLFTKV
jgi:hypothetical protein